MIFPLSNGVLLYLYIRIKGQTFETNQKKPIMKNLTIIIKQLIKIVTFDTSYPTTRINLVKYGVGEFKNGNYKYNQYKTLINYLKNRKTDLSINK